MANPYKGTGFEQEAMSAPNGKNHLLVIAIDEYAHCPKLNNCVKDAQDFVGVMLEKYRFEAENITTLYNTEATRPGIHAKLKALKKRVGPEDNLLIYFSGHGEVEDGIGYWVPVEARPANEWEFVSTSEIKARLDAINSFHTFVIVDACFSGSLFATYKSVRPGYEHKRSRWGLAASHTRERALDGQPGENSPFSEKLLRLLRNNTEDMGVQKLATEVIEAVQAATRGRQAPVFKPLDVKGDDSGQYVFRLKANESIDWEACREKNTLAAYQAFITKYPNSSQVEKAKEQIDFLREEQAWKTAQSKNTIAAYLQYRRDYPIGSYREQALRKIQELEEEQDWRRTRRRNTIFDYEKYLEKYPQSRYRREAEAGMQAILGKKTSVVKKEKTQSDTFSPQSQGKIPKSTWQTLKKSLPYLFGFFLLIALVIWGIPQVFSPSYTEAANESKVGTVKFDKENTNVSESPSKTIDGDQTTWEEALNCAGREQAIYQKIACYKEYLKQHNTGKYATEAQRRIKYWEGEEQKWAAARGRSSSAQKADKTPKKKDIASEFSIREVEHEDLGDSVKITLEFLNSNGQYPLLSGDSRIRKVKREGQMQMILYVPKGIGEQTLAAIIPGVQFEYNNNKYTVDTAYGPLKAQFRKAGDGSIQVDIMGGKPPYNLRFLSGGIVEKIIQLEKNQSFTLEKEHTRSMPPGEYTLQVYDATGNNFKAARRDEPLVVGRSWIRFIVPFIVPLVLAGVLILLLYLFRKP